jgi:DASH complex subunit Dad3
MDTASNDPNNSDTVSAAFDLGTHRHHSFSSSDNVSPLEQEVLDEYARLARNMERVRLHQI